MPTTKLTRKEINEMGRDALLECLAAHGVLEQDIPANRSDIDALRTDLVRVVFIDL